MFLDLWGAHTEQSLGEDLVVAGVAHHCWRVGGGQHLRAGGSVGAGVGARRRRGMGMGGEMWGARQGGRYPAREWCRSVHGESCWAKERVCATGLRQWPESLRGVVSSVNYGVWSGRVVLALICLLSAAGQRLGSGIES